MNINGFDVDKFNIHSIPEGAKYHTCPECSHNRKKSEEKCMSVYWDTGLGRCNHCGAQVQLHTYKKKNSTSIKQYIKPLNINTTNLDDRHVKWFEGRGITQPTLRRAQVSSGATSMPDGNGGYSRKMAIMFNYMRDGEVINVKYRDGGKNFKLVKDAERIFYNIDNIRTSKECIIAEGELDALTYMEIGRWDVVSLPNGASLKTVNLEYLDSAIDYFENKEVIYLALDMDEAGLNTQKEIIRRLGAEKCRLVDMRGYKDPNDILMAEGTRGVALSIENAKEVPIENVSSIGDWEDEYDYFLLNGMNKGYGIGKPYFDDVFSVYTGHFITITGIPSHGKTDFADEMTIGYNRLHGWKIAYASPENKPNVIHASKLEAKLTGQWVNTEEQLASDWHRNAKEYIHDNFKFIDLEKYTLENVLSKAKEMIRRFGIKVLVIDPYNKVPLEGNKDPMSVSYTSEYLLKIDEFARNNDILIILVAHPRKPSVSDGNYIPTMYDIKGSGEFYDMSPHGIVVYRDFDNEATMIKILKCKFSFLGETGSSCWFKWTRDNGRYAEFEVHAPEIENCSYIKYDYSNPFDTTNEIKEPDMAEIGADNPF